MKKTCRIIGTTNSWIANRDATFKGRTMVVFKEGLSLREAQKELLRMYNYDYDTCWSNWGLAVIHGNGNAWSGDDGIRTYVYDSRAYNIEEIEVED